MVLAKTTLSALAEKQCFVYYLLINICFFFETDGCQNYIPNFALLLCEFEKNEFFKKSFSNSLSDLGCRMVARLFIFLPKITIRVYFGGPWNGKC
jgi:hypothetical protein